MSRTPCSTLARHRDNSCGFGHPAKSQSRSPVASTACPIQTLVGQGRAADGRISITAQHVRCSAA
jgi:hypothetical protein